VLSPRQAPAVGSVRVRIGTGHSKSRREKNSNSGTNNFGNGGRNISLVVRSITERLQHRRREVS
jgi:hypothetical protein